MAFSVSDSGEIFPIHVRLYMHRGFEQSTDSQTLFTTGRGNFVHASLPLELTYRLVSRVKTWKSAFVSLVVAFGLSHVQNHVVVNLFWSLLHSCLAASSGF